MYDLIYNFIKDTLFTNEQLNTIVNDIGGVSVNMNEWLSHSLTIIALILIFIILCCFVRWIFRVFSRLFTLRG